MKNEKLWLDIFKVVYFEDEVFLGRQSRSVLRYWRLHRSIVKCNNLTKEFATLVITKMKWY